MSKYTTKYLAELEGGTLFAGIDLGLDSLVVVVLDAAIMLEAGWNKLCDRLVYVDAPRDVRLRRLAQQRGWSAKEVEAREKVQMPLAEKANRADDFVDNSGTPGQLAQQVDQLLRQWANGNLES